MKLNSELGEFHSFWYPCLKTTIIFVKNYGFICFFFFLSFLILHRKQTRLQGFTVSLLNTFKSSCLSIFPNTWSGPSSLIREFYSNNCLRFILSLPELASNICSSCPSVINALLHLLVVKIWWQPRPSLSFFFAASPWRCPRVVSEYH